MSVETAAEDLESKSLTTELSAWEKGQIEVWGYWRQNFRGGMVPDGTWLPPLWETKQVRSLDKELLRPGLRFKRIEVDWFWGWLPGGEMGEGRVDTWSICGGEEVRSDWVEVGLPRAWNGEIGSLLCTEESEQAVALLSKVSSLPGWENWFEVEYVAACRAANPPDWLRLDQGRRGERIAGDLRLLGVLKMEQPDRDSEKRLAVAWGTKEGEFLGWELVESMAEVHQVENGQVRRYGRLQSWDEVENGLRLDTLGREL